MIVTGKQCFGPASCIYHYDIDPWPTDSYPPQLPGHTAMTVIYTVTGGDQDYIGNFTINEAGVIRSDKNAVAIGPDGVNFVATATRVIAKG